MDTLNDLYDWKSPEAIIVALAAAYGGMSQFSEEDIVRAAYRRVGNNWRSIDPEVMVRRAMKLCSEALEIYREYWEEGDAQLSPSELVAKTNRINAVVDEEMNSLYD